MSAFCFLHMRINRNKVHREWLKIVVIYMTESGNEKMNWSVVPFRFLSPSQSSFAPSLPPRDPSGSLLLGLTATLSSVESRVGDDKQFDEEYDGIG